LIQDKESQIGTQSTEVGDLRNKLTNLESSVQQQQAQYQQQIPQNPYGQPPQYGGGQPMPQYGQPAQQPYGQPEHGLPDTDFPNAGETRQMVEQRLQNYEMQRQQQEAQRLQYDAQNAFVEGRDSAFKENPELFKGIENEIVQGMQGYWAMNQGNPSLATSLRNKDTWLKAARFMRVERGEFDVLKAPQGNPMAHTQTEVPGQVKNTEQEKTVVFNAEQDEMFAGLGKAAGITKEEAADGVKERRAERERNNQ
jgi:hypothetical protein